MKYKAVRFIFGLLWTPFVLLGMLAYFVCRALMDGWGIANMIDENTKIGINENTKIKGE